MDKKGNHSETTTVVVMGIIASILVLLGYQKGGGEHIRGLRFAGNMLLQVTPVMIFAFIVAGMVQVLLPPQKISKWIGMESGFKGLFIAAAFGSLTPGGPFVCLPIAAGLLRAGGSVGMVVSFITGWSLWAVNLLILEVTLLGWKFASIRLVCTFLFPPLAGLLANLIVSHSRTIREERAV